MQLALTIATSIVSCHKSVAASLKACALGITSRHEHLQDKFPVLAPALSLSVSPLLHGAPLDALQEFFHTLSVAGEPSLNYGNILDVWDVVSISST